MKCRKPECAKAGGAGLLTQETLQGIPIYQCTRCGRKWAVGKIPMKGRKVKNDTL